MSPPIRSSTQFEWVLRILRLVKQYNYTHAKTRIYNFAGVNYVESQTLQVNLEREGYVDFKDGKIGITQRGLELLQYLEYANTKVEELCTE